MTTSVVPEPELLDAPAASPKAAFQPEPPALEHEYDGIREYDNPLPRWWVNLFWATFVFSLGYVFHYHVSGRGPSVLAVYEQEERVAQAERSKLALAEAPSEEALATLANDPELMKAAGADFSRRCAPCHGSEGQGVIGPNLTDEHWLHGSGTLMDLYQVVSGGVPDKGMPAWQNQLSPADLRKVVAYVGTLRGKNLPGKPPQGPRVTAP